MSKSNSKALLLLSGGQDSTTSLAWAMEKFSKVYGICFDYEQRHKIEIKSAIKIAKITKTPLKIQKIDFFKDLTDNALTNKTKKFTTPKNKLPNTFVPGRNLIFLSIAAIYARKLKINDIITGVCQTDFSGYPDCRNQFIKSLEKTLQLSMETPFKIHTPIMWLTKAQTVKLMQQLGKIELLKYSHSCYKGLRIACGKCPACKLRLKGFQEAEIIDPIEYAK